MTTVDDLSTTRKTARYKGSRPRNQENSDYADLRIMPMWLENPLQGNGFLLARSA